MNRRPHGYLGGRGELVVVIDCSDLHRAAQFWTSVLGYLDAGGSSSTYRSLLPADGVGIEVLLQRVLDEKRQKNRVHLDLRTPDLESEVSRVRGLGATPVTSEPVLEEGWRWHVLADPDGNEFCILQPPADHRAQ